MTGFFVYAPDDNYNPDSEIGKALGHLQYLYYVIDTVTSVEVMYLSYGTKDSRPTPTMSGIRTRSINKGYMSNLNGYPDWLRLALKQVAHRTHEVPVSVISKDLIERINPFKSMLVTLERQKEVVMYNTLKKFLDSERNL